MLQIGALLGKYRIVRQLGEGGMGSVFEVTHVELERRAALKIMLPQHAQNPLLRARFVREAKATNRVHHPGVVQIYEISELADGTPYFIMEYLDGETLAKRLDDAAARPEGRLGMAGLHALRQVASIIAKVHEKGLIHRDLKPNNIMLVTDPEVPGGERAKLLDFGIAKQAESSPTPATDPAGRIVTEPKTQIGSLLGTPQYMAPEQWGNGKPVTEKVDVYAMGVMTYRVLSGRLPFLGEAPLELATQHVFHAPAPLREICPGLPAKLAEFIDSMLAKTAEARPSMAEVVGTFERILGLPPDAANSQIEIPDSFSSAQQVPVPGKPTTPVDNVAPPPGASGSGAFIPSVRPARADATTADNAGKSASAPKTISLEPEDLIAGGDPDGSASPQKTTSPKAAPPPLRTASTPSVRWGRFAGILVVLLGLLAAGLFGKGGSSACMQQRSAVDAMPASVDLLAAESEDGQRAADAQPGTQEGDRLRQNDDLLAVEPTASDLGFDRAAVDAGAGSDLGALDASTPRGDTRPSGKHEPTKSPGTKRPPPAQPSPLVPVSPSCIRTPGLAGTLQEALLIDGFKRSIASLPAGERVVLVLQSGKITLQEGSPTMRANQKLLEYTLRGQFLTTPFPARVEIQCPAH